MFRNVILQLVVLQLGIGAVRADNFPPIRLCPAAVSSTFETIPVQRHTAVPTVQTIHTEHWSWQLFPDGFIYPNYIAAVQNRLGAAANYDSNIDWNWDITLGGKAPLVRFGNQSVLFPEGWQLDLEGSVHLRLAFMEQMDMEANDFRAGLPISYGTKVWQFKTGYYHVSTHIGDERLLRYYDNPDPYYANKKPYKGGRANDAPHRLNYVREALLLSFAIRPTPNSRAYAEADYAFAMGELTKPWHFQFGLEYSPVYPARGGWGTPYAAANVRLMQEHGFDGNITLQTGWQWRGSRNELFRLGMQYFHGVSEQYSFMYHPKEHKVGFGAWYDF